MPEPGAAHGGLRTRAKQRIARTVLDMAADPDFAPSSVERMPSFISGRIGQGTWRQMSDAITPG